MKQVHRGEVAIIGGGPAGATAAIALAKLGRRVVLCEAARYPRDHIGVSISAGVRQQLAFLGAERLLDRECHLQNIPIVRRWASESFEPPSRMATILDRGMFDAELLDAARQSGVDVLQPALIEDCQREADGWRLKVAARSSDVSVHGSFVIDARGRRSSDRRRKRQGAPTLAVCGYWTRSSGSAVRIAAHRDFWCWEAPAGKLRSVVVCFVDPKMFRCLPGSQRSRYLSLGRATGMLDGFGDQELEKVITCDATPYAAEGETEGLLRVGDADIALDPLSSSGVQAAIQSGLSAGPIVNTLLTRGIEDGPALKFWRERRTRQIAQHRQWAALHYEEAFEQHQSEFWKARRGDVFEKPASRPAPSVPCPPNQPVALSKETSFVSSPCLIGGVVESLECVSHPHLHEPVAFVAGAYVPKLLKSVQWPSLRSHILQEWSIREGRGALAVFEWAWQFQILETAAQEIKSD